MNGAILNLDSIGKSVFSVLVNTSLQVAFLILLVWLAIWIFRFRSTATRYYLWLMVIFGAITLPILGALLSGINPQIMSESQVTAEPANNDIKADNTSELVSTDTAAENGSVETSRRVTGMPGFDMMLRGHPGVNTANPRPGLSLFSIISLIWFVVSAFMLYRLLKGYLWLRKLKRGSLVGAYGRMPLQVISRLREQMGIKRRIELFASSAIHSPISFGIFSATIILPGTFLPSAKAAPTFSPLAAAPIFSPLAKGGQGGFESSIADLEMVLSHEMAHIRRFDYLVNLLQRVLQSVFFFHPLFQIASRRLTREREHICDDWVIQTTGKRDDYAECLIRLVEEAIIQPKSISMAMMGHPHNIAKRVDMIIDDGRKIITRLSRKVMAAILLAGCILLPMLTAARAVYTAELRSPFLAPHQLDIPEEPAARLGRGLLFKCAHSPDGKLIAVAGSMGIWLYNAADLTEAGFLKGHNCFSVAFSPDSRLLASTGWWDKSVRVWDVAEKKEIFTILGQNQFMYSVSFSPDGKLFAYTGGWPDNTIYLCDIEMKKEIGILTGHTGYLSSVSFSPDGRLLASGGGDKTIRLWNVAERKEVALLMGHNEGVNYVSFSPDGKLLASASYDKTVRLWDLATKKEIASLANTGFQTASFSPDGKMLAAGGIENDKEVVKLWDLETKTQVASLDHVDQVGCVSFSPDGKRLAVSGNWGGVVQLWDMETKREIATINDYTYMVYGVAFSPDGNLLASGERGGGICLWDMETKREIARLKDNTNKYIYSVSFSPDGKLLASGSFGIVTIWDVAEKKDVAVLKGHEGENSVNTVSFSPNGKLIASGGYDKTIIIWDVEKRKEIDTLKGHTNPVICLAFSPNSKLLASGSDDYTVRLWDVASGKEITVIREHIAGVCGVSFSPDGKMLASGGYDGKIRLWNIEKPEEPVGAGVLNTGLIDSLTFSPDGRFIVSGERDNTAKIWDVAEKRLVGVLRGHTYSISSLSFTPDGKWLATSSWDGVIFLWELNLQGLKSVESQGKALVTWGKLKRTELYQNYPNPFNPETWIPFRLAKPSDVTISIYNQTGQLVRTLNLGYKEVGAYLEKSRAGYWDGRDDEGEPVASGVYFYRLDAGNFHQTRKMVVLR